MNEARLRALLDDAVAPIEPTGPLPAALTRAAERRRRRSALAGGLVAVAVVATAGGLAARLLSGASDTAVVLGPEAQVLPVFPLRDPAWVAAWERSPATEPEWTDGVGAVQAFAREWLEVEAPMVSPRPDGGYDLAVAAQDGPRVVAQVETADAGGDEAPGPFVVTRVSSAGLRLDAPEPLSRVRADDAAGGPPAPDAGSRIDVRGTAAPPAVTVAAALRTRAGSGGYGDLRLEQGGRFEEPVPAGTEPGVHAVLVVARDEAGDVTAVEAVPVLVTRPGAAPSDPAPEVERGFAALSDGAATLHVVTAEGGSRLVRRLVEAEGPVRVTAVATDSAAGTVLVGRTDVDACRSRLWSVQRDGSALTPLDEERTGRIDAVSVAGFGALVVTRPCAGGPAAVRVVDLELGGGMPFPVGGDVRQAAYAPDGDVAVVRSTGELVVLVPDGRGGAGPTTVSPAPGCSLASPAWSLDRLYAAERCGTATSVVVLDALTLQRLGRPLPVTGEAARTVGGLAHAHSGELLVLLEDAAGRTEVRLLQTEGDRDEPPGVLLSGPGCRSVDDGCLRSADW